MKLHISGVQNPCRHIAAITAAAALLIYAPSALAWGPEGHEIVAGIAARELSPAALHAVERLIGAPARSSMPEVSNWADWIKRGRPETKPWHYVDIEIGSAGYDARRDCPDDDCVVAQIARDEAILRDRSRPREQRIEALKFLIHFMGDIHQPLHASDDHDRGGNMVRVTIGNYDTNLHAVWDSDVVAMIGEDPVDVATRLDHSITPAERTAWAKGSAADWANESFAIARDRIYARQPRPNQSGEIVFSPSRLQADAPLVALQLEKAGVRLAHILDESLGP